jgi:aldose 1-epimerase
VRLTAGDASLTIDPERGGRIVSFTVAGVELIVWERFRSIDWGAYPMAPFAGRLRDARLRFDGREFTLPANERTHAIHGTAFERPWRVIDDRTLAFDLGEPWPFAGLVTQRFDLASETLEAEMTLEADEPMPAVLGWHPWFIRELARPGTSPAELHVDFGRMYERDAEGLPTGRIGPVAAPPWDDCFVEPRIAPTIRWPGFLDLRIESDATHWVVYTGDTDAIAVEPQTGPPDGPNIEPRIVVPGTPLTIGMRWAWRRIGES